MRFEPFHAPNAPVKPIEPKQRSASVAIRFFFAASIRAMMPQVIGINPMKAICSSLGIFLPLIHEISAWVETRIIATLVMMPMKTKSTIPVLGNQLG